MPLTFPSHAAAVLPLKLWRPRRFDGIALVVGSTAPDLIYPFAAIVAHPKVHSLTGLLWWSLPVTVLCTWLIRQASPRVAAHLPRLGPLALRDYGALGPVRHAWRVTVLSALIGAVTHLVWDGLTHSPQTSGWLAALFPPLDDAAVAGLPWYRVFQHVSTVAGALVALGTAVLIGRRRLIRRWHGPAPAVRGRRWLFWGTFAAVLSGYPLSWAHLTHLYQPHVQGTRLLCFAGVGLLAGAAATALADALAAVRSRRAAPADP